jgi:tetratricopeptide (TPR) repeat protein
MSASSTTLTVSDLIGLAIGAAARNENEQAIELCKRALEVSPRASQAHYLLGAQYAQIGMFERAMDEIRTALEIQPELHEARFQLGLLLLTEARVPEAIDAWHDLEELPETYSLRQFQQGLRQMAEDRFVEAISSLEAGMAMNRTNAALNADMARVIEEMRRAGEDPPLPGPAAPHILLTAYESK